MKPWWLVWPQAAFVVVTFLLLINFGGERIRMSILPHVYHRPELAYVLGSMVGVGGAGALGIGLLGYLHLVRRRSREYAAPEPAAFTTGSHVLASIGVLAFAAFAMPRGDDDALRTMAPQFDRGFWPQSKRLGDHGEGFGVRHG